MDTLAFMSDSLFPLQASTDEHTRVMNLFQSFHLLYREFLNDIAKRVDLATELNKQTSAFYERLMLVSLGTISLSVTAVTSFAPKAAVLSPHGKHVITWLIAIAWVLLLLAVFACRQAVAVLNHATGAAFSQWNSMTMSYYSEHISKRLNDISSAISGSIVHEGEEKDASKLLSELSQKIKAGLGEEAKKKLDKLTTTDVNRVGRLAVLSVQFALVLLCVAAIKILFAL